MHGVSQQTRRARRQHSGKVMTIPANAPACSTAAMIHNLAPRRDHAHRSGRCELRDQPANQGVKPLWLGCSDKRRRLNRSLSRAEPKFRIHHLPAGSLQTFGPWRVARPRTRPGPAFRAQRESVTCTADTRLTGSICRILKSDASCPLEGDARLQLTEIQAVDFLHLAHPA